MVIALLNGGGGCRAPWSADPWAVPTSPLLFPEEGTMARGHTKVAWSSTIASAARISALDGSGIVEWAAAGVVVEDFGVPLPAMACG